MAETAVSTDSNPITSDSKCLLRKQNSSPNTVHTSCHGSNPPPPDPPVNDGESVIQDHHNNSELFHEDDAESSSSDSEGEGSSESSDESSEGEGEVSDEQELRNAGVEIDLNTLGPLDMGVAPLELLSEFVSCCVRDEHKAALILCKKVLEFEPGNNTALQFFPVLQERLKLDDELPTESSSDEEEGGDTCDHTHSHHSCTA